jgi:hypothetical protein
MGRWDHLYELTPRPTSEWLLDALAEDLERDVRAFPPEVTWEDEAYRARYASLLASGRAPSETVVRTALWLARSDLSREYEAVDQFVRGGGLEERLGSPEDRELCRFLWRFFVDKPLAFAEATQGRFSRAQLADALVRLERRLYGSPH